MTYCTDWNHVDVRDFDVLKNIYDQNVDHSSVERDILDLGKKLRLNLGLNWTYFGPEESQYIVDM